RRPRRGPRPRAPAGVAARRDRPPRLPPPPAALAGGPFLPAHALARAGRARVLPADAGGGGAGPAAPRRRLPAPERRGRRARRLRARAARGGVAALGGRAPTARDREEPLSRPAPPAPRGALRGERDCGRPGDEPAPALGPRAGADGSPAG